MYLFYFTTAYIFLSSVLSMGFSIHKLKSHNVYETIKLHDYLYGGFWMIIFILSFAVFCIDGGCYCNYFRWFNNLI